MVEGVRIDFEWAPTEHDGSSRFQIDGGCRILISVLRQIISPS